MLYWGFSVFVLLVLNCFQYGLSTNDIEYGLTQAEKAAKGVCWVEQFNNGGTSYGRCRYRNDYMKTLLWHQDGYRKQWNGPETIPPKENEESVMVEWMQGDIENRILNHLPKYKSCLPATQDVYENPTKDYGWLLGDSDEEKYPYKEFAHCLLNVAEELNGRQVLDDLKNKWEKEPILFSDIERGLSNAEKAAKLVCWYEKVKKEYPIDNEGVSYSYCRENVDYIKTFMSYLNEYNEEMAADEQSPTTIAEDTTLLSSIRGFLRDRINGFLPKYESCIQHAGIMEATPTKDFQWVLGDQEDGDYPYKGFTYCLLEVLEDRNGKNALDELKSKLAQGTGYSFKDIESGLARMEKVAKGICWYDKIKKHYDGWSYPYCRRNVDYVQKFISYVDEYNTDNADSAKVLATNAEDTNLPGKVQGLLEYRIQDHLPEYGSCLKFTQDMEAKPTKDYAWLLGNTDEADYPYKAFTYCLLELLEFNNGKEALDVLKAKLDKDSVFSTADIENGLTWAEKAAKLVCTEESKLGQGVHCNDNDIDFIKTFKSYVDEYNDEIAESGTLPATNVEDTHLPYHVQSFLRDRINSYFPSYSTCLPFAQDMGAQPSTDYESLLEDSNEGEYSYRGFSHCLLEILDGRKGNKPMADVVEVKETQHISEEVLRKTADESLSNVPIQTAPVEEDAVEVVKNSDEPLADIPIKEMTIKDVEYGLAQATKIAAGICWTEKLNIPYPINKEAHAFRDCLEGHDYIKHLQWLRDRNSRNWAGPGPMPEETQNTHTNCYVIFASHGIRKHLPSYSACELFLEDTNGAPNKDYGWFLGESERNEYPYKGYAHCLLAAMEFHNGKESLNELKSHWENPKRFTEAFLERENEHRARHGSPSLEMDEELTSRAQRYAEQLAEDCGSGGMTKSYDDMIYEGSNCGENTYTYFSTELSDEELAVMTAIRWYEEIESYPWPAFNGSWDVWRENTIRHFTQSVWKNSKRVGYGFKRGTECKRTYVVARYWPEGNTFHSPREETQEAFEENVMPLINEVSKEDKSQTREQFRLPGMSSNGSPFEDLEIGIIEVEKVMKGVCWAEKFNNPLTNCWIWADYYTQFVKYRWAFRKHFATEETLAEDKATLVGRMYSLIQTRIKRLLPGYEVCEEYSKDIYKIAPKDYGTLLGDNPSVDDPYRGFTNCLLEILENRNGENALEDLKSKWDTPKTFQQMMLEAQNRHRARHGVPPLELDDELTTRAQRWADYLSNEKCEMVHMYKEKPNHPDLTYKEDECGENIGGSRNLNDTDDEIGLQVAAQFYKEIELYPWPAYDGDFKDKLFPEIGHFSQTVWKETSLAGYAIARGKCDMMYVVARYWPSGNVMHQFEQSVLPAIK